VKDRVGSSSWTVSRLSILALMTGCAPQAVSSRPPLAVVDEGADALQSWHALAQALPGRWTTTIGDREIAVDYRITSGGTVLLETWMPGTPAETITTFHLDAQRLVLTHYCGQGNQPRLQMQTCEGDTWSFERFDVTDRSPEEAALEALSLAVDGGSMVRTETYERAGQRETSVLRFEREAQSAM